MTRTLGLAALLSAALAVPGAVGGTAAPAPADPCAAGRWTLEGASEKPGDGQAAFVPAWAPALQAIAGCLRAPAARDACLLVRGHADEVPFAEPLVTALGSQDAAQVARARGRAMMVIAALADLGIGAERVREGPPVLRSSFRGVEIGVVPGCLDTGAREGADPAALSALVDRRIAAALAAHEARPAAPAPAYAAARAAAPAVAPPELDARRAPYRFFVDAALDATVLGFDPSTVFAPAIQLGVGWRGSRAFARLGAGFATGSEPEQRVGFEATLSGGWTLGRRLELGPLVRYRLSSVKATAPWLEQTFTFGAQASQCRWALPRLGGELCLSGAVLPLGFRQVQGTAADGRAVRAPWETRYSAEVLVGVSLRKLL